MSEADQQSRPLDDARRRLEAVLNNATVSIFLMDERQHCIYMNQAAEALTGYSLEEVLSLNKPLHDIIHHQRPDGSLFLLADCAIDRAFPQHNQVQGEEVFVHRDGSFYPVAFTASPISDEASQTIGTIIEVRDIREEKQARERQQLLLNELNHRVKNTLSTVQALALHSFRTIPAEQLDQFNGRLLALSKAHDLLHGSAWQGASFAEVVTAATEPFGAERFCTEGPDCPIDPKASVSLSMVLHELGTNAAKHGALSHPGGKVHLTWTCEDGGDHRELAFTWTETGGPPVTPPERAGFGSRLIQRQAAAEFDGSAALDYRAEGLHCTICAKIPALAAPEPMR